MFADKEIFELCFKVEKIYEQSAESRGVSTETFARYLLAEECFATARKFVGDRLVLNTLRDLPTIMAGVTVIDRLYEKLRQLFARTEAFAMGGSAQINSAMTEEVWDMLVRLGNMNKPGMSALAIDLKNHSLLIKYYTRVDSLLVSMDVTPLPLFLTNIGGINVDEFLRGGYNIQPLDSLSGGVRINGDTVSLGRPTPNCLIPLCPKLARR